LTTELTRRVDQHTRLQKRKTGQRKINTKKILLIVVGLLIFSLAAGASYLYFGGNLNKAKRTMGLTGMPNKINILVLGVDERADDGGRSDTMMVFTVDTKTDQVNLLSVPRDTRVKIPGHGWDKINHAYAEGKYKLSMQAVEDLLGISFDYYVVINFSGFCKIVDAIGGVDINVEKRMFYQDPYDNLTIDLYPGQQHMDGKTAIQYARYRDGEGDIGRIARQQKFVKAVLKAVTSPGIIPRIPAMLKEIGAAVQTNMTTAEMANFAKLLNNAQKVGLTAEMVPGTPAYIDDVSYWLPDVVALRKYVAQTQGSTLSSSDAVADQKLAVEYQRSIPKEMEVLDPIVLPEKAKPELNADGTKPVSKPEPVKPPVTAANEKLTVSVINASGKPNAGAKIVALLKARGFEVVSVANASQVVETSSVVSYSKDNTVSGKLTGLPFDYSLQVKPDDTKSVKASVVIGKNYE